MNTLQARALLEKLAVQHVLKVAGISSIGESTNWTSRAIGTTAELRLSWRQADEQLTLEVSHGASDGNVAGWLLLYGETCMAQDLPLPESPERTFEECVLYGLELMAPRRPSSDA